MTDRYVDPSVGASGTGGSWAQAYKTLKEATDAAAAGETIYFHNGTANTLTTTTTFTLAAGVKIISTSDNTNNPPTTYASGATVTGASNAVAITIAGSGAVYGVTFLGGTSGSYYFTIGDNDNQTLYFEDCIFQCNSAGAAFGIQIGRAYYANNAVTTKNCKFRFGAAAQYIFVNARWMSVCDVFADSGSVPTILIMADLNWAAVCDAYITGADLSAISGTLVDNYGNSPYKVHISSSKLHASVTPLAAQASLGESEIFLYDCSYDNAGTLTGLLFYHENYLGSTTISTSIYANDGAQYDGTNRCSWVVDGKSTASFANPYESPWIDQYNSTLTAITPKFEVVRSGSSTAYTDEQVWAEFAYRGTANSPLYTIASDRRGPLATAGNQGTGALGASDWTGENATSWFGKLETTASITPAEVGHIRGRICVAGDYTVHVDPKIRTA